jgi:hypothetical protein
MQKSLASLVSREKRGSETHVESSSCRVSCGDVGVWQGPDQGGANGAWRYLRKNNVSKLLDKRQKVLCLGLTNRQRLIAAGGLAPGARGEAQRSASMVVPAPCFIPLDMGKDVEGGLGALAEGVDGGWGEESLEDMLTRRTKAFNISTREDPQNVSNWLEFVALQDEFLQVP